MKNTWKWLFAGLLAVVIVCGIVLGVMNNEFHKPGIHITGNYALTGVQKKCYFIEGGNVTGESTFSISGYLHDSIWETKQEDFYGRVGVDQYPVTKDATGVSFSGSITSGKYLFLTNQQTVLLNENWEYYYQIYIFESDPDLIAVFVTPRDGKAVTAICADSADEALSAYEKFNDTYQKYLKALK